MKQATMSRDYRSVQSCRNHNNTFIKNVKFHDPILEDSLTQDSLFTVTDGAPETHRVRNVMASRYEPIYSERSSGLHTLD